MRIGVLKTGDVNPALVPAHGEYVDMFARLLQRVDPALDVFQVDVDGGAALGQPQDADGWLITGSRHGVYEDHPWIVPLKDFLRRTVAARVPVVGVCFGHQILAEALGGRVVKSEKGWGLGVHDYDPGKVPDWMGALTAPWSGHAVHQDQIVDLPPGATVLARSPFCDYAALVYGDPEDPDALSVQPHPEFDAALIRDLIDVRLKDIVPADVVAAGRASLDRTVDATGWAEAMVTFFRKRGAGT